MYQTHLLTPCCAPGTRGPGGLELSTGDPSVAQTAGVATGRCRGGREVTVSIPALRWGEGALAHRCPPLWT